MKTVSVELNPKFLLYTILTIGGVILLWELRGVVAIFFTGFVLNAGLRPLVDLLEKRKVPRSISVLIILLIFLTIVVVGFLTIANEFVTQIVLLFDQLPAIFSKMVIFVESNVPFLADLIPLGSLEQEITAFVTQALTSDTVTSLVTGENVLAVLQQSWGIFGSVGGLLTSIVTVMMITVYMLLRKTNVYDGVISLLPDNLEDSSKKLLEKIEVSLGAWLPGQFALMVSIGVITYLLLVIPGLLFPDYTLDQYALPIAILAGFLEAIPNIGPIITLVLTSLLALGTSGVGSVIYIIIAFTVLQTAEGVFIVPLVMKRAVGIDPIVIILGLLAAFQLGGVIGALLIVPILAVLQIILVETSKEHKKRTRQRPKLL